jgi:PilZ domain
MQKISRKDAGIAGMELRGRALATDFTRLADNHWLSRVPDGRAMRKSQMLGAGSRFPDRRVAQRFAFDAHMEIIDPMEQKQIAGRVTALSEKGCFGRIQAPMTQGAVVQVQIKKDEAKFETWARATPNRRDADTGVALVFMDVPPEQAKLLAKWLEGLMET